MKENEIVEIKKQKIKLEKEIEDNNEQIKKLEDINIKLQNKLVSFDSKFDIIVQKSKVSPLYGDKELDKKFKDVTSELQDLKMQNKNLDEQRDHYKQIAELSTDTLNELSKQYESVVKEKSIIERERNTILEDLNKQIVNYKIISEQLRLERIKANENIITINDLKNKVKSLEFSTKEFDTNFEDKFRNDLKIREKKIN